MRFLLNLFHIFVRHVALTYTHIQRQTQIMRRMPSHILVACHKCDNTYSHTHSQTDSLTNTRTHRQTISNTHLRMRVTNRAYKIRKFHAQFQICAGGIPEQSSHAHFLNVYGMPTRSTCRIDNVHFVSI